MTDAARDKIRRAKATLRLIRDLDARIKRTDGKVRAALMRERLRLVLRYIAELGHGVLLVVMGGAK